MDDRPVGNDRQNPAYRPTRPHIALTSAFRPHLSPQSISLARHVHSCASIPDAFSVCERQRRAALAQPQSEARFSARWFGNIERYAGLPDEQLFALLRERRSPLLARIPPRWHYEPHQANERFDIIGKLRGRVGPTARSAYSRLFG